MSILKGTTPGDWTIGPNEPSLKTLGKLLTYEIGGKDSATWNCMVLADKHGEANAKLIAAAPTLARTNEELRAALEPCVHSLELLLQDELDAGTTEGLESLREDVARARAALKRAEE